MYNSICLIIPYFGKFPDYFRFWLQSCANNNSVNWLIFTDNVIDKMPENVTVINISFEDLRKKIQSNFNFKISLPYVYKLCDFRPAYGYIFREYLNEYTYWGYCDMDLIFGNIRKFIPDIILNTHDHLFMHGHFNLFRNENSINQLFMHPAGNYAKILSNSISYGFDEFNAGRSGIRIGEIIKLANIRQYTYSHFDDIRKNQKNFYSPKMISDYEHIPIKKVRKLPSFYEYNNGTLLRHVLINKEEQIAESMYVHFQKRIFGTNTKNTNQYFIIPNKFIPINNNHEVVFNQCKYTCWYPHYWNIRFQYLKRKIYNLFYNENI